jgi:hypothetical protein
MYGKWIAFGTHSEVGGAGYRMAKMHSQDNLMLVRSFNFKVDLNDGRGALFHAQETVGQGTASSTGWLR